MISLTREVAMMSKVKHDYILEMIAFKRDGLVKKNMYKDEKPKNVAYMVIPFVKGGELADYYALGGLPEDICRYFFRQILIALHHLHEQGIAHLDVKAYNILVDDDTFTIKLADFGLALDNG